MTFKEVFEKKFYGETMTYSICKNKFVDKTSCEPKVQKPDDYSEILEDLEQQTQPKHSSQYHFDRGIEYFNNTAYGKAIEHFLNVTEENIREVALSSIAFSHYMLGNTDTALRYANQIFAINPKNDLAFDVIADIESGQTYQGFARIIRMALAEYKENNPKKYSNFKNTTTKKLKRFSLNVAQALKLNNGLSHKFENQIISKDDKINLLLEVFKKQIDNKSYEINDKVEELFLHSIKRWFEANSDSFQSREDVIVFFDVLIKYGSYLADGYLAKSPISDKERKQKLEIQFAKRTHNLIPKALASIDDIIRKEASFDDVNKITTNAKRMMIKNYNIKVYRECYHLKGNYKSEINTIPRMFWQIMDEIKILPKGHFLEVKRENLVGQDRKKTIEKTNAVLEKVKGGILFVNETNHHSNDIGKVAIDTIITHIKNNQNSFSLIVGGYYENSGNLWINLWLPSQEEKVELQVLSLLQLRLQWD
jgi:tetratricopeptide (TPR) repeat protein